MLLEITFGTNILPFLIMVIFFGIPMIWFLIKEFGLETNFSETRYNPVLETIKDVEEVNKDVQPRKEVVNIDGWRVVNPHLDITPKHNLKIAVDDGKTERLINHLKDGGQLIGTVKMPFQTKKARLREGQPIVVVRYIATTMDFLIQSEGIISKINLYTFEEKLKIANPIS